MGAAKSPRRPRLAGRKAMLKTFPESASTALRWVSSLNPENPVFVHAEAIVALRAGRHRDAENLLKRAMAATKRAFGASHPQVAAIVHDLHELYERQRRDADARKLCERVAAEMDLSVAVIANAKTLGLVAELFRRAGREGDIAELYQRAVAHRQDIYGDGHPKTAECLAELAGIYRREGKPAEARALLDRASTIIASAGGEKAHGLAKRIRGLRRSISAA